MPEETRRIFLVDDDSKLLRLLGIRLERKGYVVDSALNGKEALARISTFRPHLVITDMQMPGMDGLTLFDQLHQREPALPVIILTAHGTIPHAVAATRRGIFAYLTKPFDSEELEQTIRKALAIAGNHNGKAQQDDKSWRAEILSRSQAIETLLADTKLIAQSDSSVMIQGESGSGKELLARAIHNASPRRKKAFVAVNCTAIPEALFESELFGHLKGSFTGANQGRQGLFEAANGGTLFLDEIGDMPLAFQAKLLRALEERRVRPVGATRAIDIDIRVICATHHNLEKAVANNAFREDLYYRLNVVTLDIPPLAKRREDIPLLANHFLAERSARQATETSIDKSQQVKGFASDAMELLVSAPWPGNIRQLRNVVEQCVVLSTTELIPASLVRRALRDKPRELLPFAAARDRFELDYLVHLLMTTQGNVTQAARLAERNRSEFYKLLRKHHLDPELFRSED